MSLENIEQYTPYAGGSFSVAESLPAERVAFIRKTYAHLGGAMVLFVGLTALWFQVGLAEEFGGWALGTRFGWLAVLIGFMAVSSVADRWARSGASQGTQYAGLLLYVVAESIIFLPLLLVAVAYSSPDVLPNAAITTLAVFAGLSAVVFVSGADFSFLRVGLGIASFAALGLIAASIVMGFSLGLWFSVGMAVFAGSCVLYSTSAVMRDYRPGQHVAASLALFASVALLFWYILRIFIATSRR